IIMRQLITAIQNIIVDSAFRSLNIFLNGRPFSTLAVSGISYSSAALYLSVPVALFKISAIFSLFPRARWNEIDSGNCFRKNGVITTVKILTQKNSLQLKYSRK